MLMLASLSLSGAGSDKVDGVVDILLSLGFNSELAFDFKVLVADTGAALLSFCDENQSKKALKGYRVQLETNNAHLLRSTKNKKRLYTTYCMSMMWRPCLPMTLPATERCVDMVSVGILAWKDWKAFPKQKGDASKKLTDSRH